MGWAPILAGRAEGPPHLQSLYPISCGVLMLQNPAVLRGGVFPAGKHAHIDDHSVLTLFVWQLRRINPVFYMMITCLDIDGLVQERCNSIANALELHLSCITHRYVTSNPFHKCFMIKNTNLVKVCVALTWKMVISFFFVLFCFIFL